MTEDNLQLKPYPLGAHSEGEGIRFSFVSEKESCGVLIYNKKTGKQIDKIPFDTSRKIGNIHCCYVTKYLPREITYQFYEDDIIVPDYHAKVYNQKVEFGNVRREEDLMAGFLSEEFDWEGDNNPAIPYEESICYLLHVRGFTKHSSSKVVNKGTFLGVLEKLDYLKDIGITTVELQPAYEYLELSTVEEERKESPYVQNPKLNYWGYKRGCYYAPKSAYGVKDATVEFKELVKVFHRNHMEIVMQFYFPKEVAFLEILEILRYWILEYHVDGFHLMGENLPVELLAEDPLLACTKLWYYHFDTDRIYSKNKSLHYRNLASYGDGYLYTMRKFLKGDEDMVKSVLFEMRQNPEMTGRIHYMSNYYGMSLMDMVSYDRKHNEDNGEENRDGNDYNCSWNCGEEGPTRKKKVAALRMRQIKNAMCMLMLSQSTPLIFMGDEFGNSQKGNNNPYCQDNVITWLNWRDMERNQAILSFWKELVKIRKDHPVLHQPKEPRIMDYIACGYPDLSYHGMNAWRPQVESYSRCVGMMYCGKYVKNNYDKEDCFFYIAMNMHWEEHEFGLPKLPKGMKWQMLLSTEDSFKKDNNSEIGCEIGARTIAIFCSIEEKSISGIPGDKMAKDRTIF